MARRRSRRPGLAIAGALLLAACAPAAPASTTSPAPIASAPPSPARTPSPRLDDPAWQRASTLDPLDLERLAASSGVFELLEGVADGGDVARTALAALPFAEDADLALRSLGERAASAASHPLAVARTGEPAASISLVLQAMLDIAGRPPAPREPLDPEGVRAAAEALLALAAPSSPAPDARALAISAARALAEKGYVDPARIPSDLDVE